MQPSSWRLLVPPFPSATFLKAIPPLVPASRGLLPWGTAPSPHMPVSPSSNIQVPRPTPTHGMSSQGRGPTSSQHILSSAPACVCMVTAPRGPWQPDTPPSEAWLLPSSLLPLPSAPGTVFFLTFWNTTLSGVLSLPALPRTPHRPHPETEAWVWSEDTSLLFALFPGSAYWFGFWTLP